MLASRIFQNLEEQLFKMPRQRVWQLENEIAQEQKRRQEAERKLAEVYKRFRQRNHLQEEAIEINQKIDKMATQISKDLATQIETVVLLKNHARDLHVKLGDDDNLSWFNTLCAAREWNHLDPLVKALMAAGPQKTKMGIQHGKIVHLSAPGESPLE